MMQRNGNFEAVTVTGTPPQERLQIGDPWNLQFARDLVHTTVIGTPSVIALCYSTALPKPALTIWFCLLLWLHNLLRRRPNQLGASIHIWQ